MKGRVSESLRLRAPSSVTTTATTAHSGNARGQSMVEFALVSTIAMFILVVGAQVAIIANAALAVSQLVSQGTRYAAVNPTYTSDTISSYVKGAASNAINENNGGHLTVTVNPTTAPRTTGTSVSITLSYNAAGKIVLPNPFFGISFPTTLSATETAMSE